MSQFETLHTTERQPLNTTSSSSLDPPVEYEWSFADITSAPSNSSASPPHDSSQILSITPSSSIKMSHHGSIMNNPHVDSIIEVDIIGGGGDYDNSSDNDVEDDDICSDCLTSISRNEFFHQDAFEYSKIFNNNSYNLDHDVQSTVSSGPIFAMLQSRVVQNDDDQKIDQNDDDQKIDQNDDQNDDNQKIDQNDNDQKIDSSLDAQMIIDVECVKTDKLIDIEDIKVIETDDTHPQCSYPSQIGNLLSSTHDDQHDIVLEQFPSSNNTGDKEEDAVQLSRSIHNSNPKHVSIGSTQSRHIVDESNCGVNDDNTIAHDEIFVINETSDLEQKRNNLPPSPSGKPSDFGMLADGRTIYPFPIINNVLSSISVLDNKYHHTTRQVSSQQQCSKQQSFHSHLNTPAQSGFAALPPHILHENPSRKTLLVLGEKGSGKSSFINGFATYLQNLTVINPVVVIPTKYHNINTDMEGRPIADGVVNVNNGDNNNSYGRQTQSGLCSTYSFPIGDSILEIIDTPSINNTEDSKQDIINIDLFSAIESKADSLCGIVLVIDGTSSCIPTTLQNAFHRLSSTLSGRLMGNIIIAFTNTYQYQLKFDLKGLETIANQADCFYFQNSLFSINPAHLSTVFNADRDFQMSNQSYKMLYLHITQRTVQYTKWINILRNLRHKIASRMHDLQNQMVTLAKVTDSLERFEQKRHNDESKLTEATNSESKLAESTNSFSNCPLTIIECRWIPSDRFSTICSRCDAVCHEASHVPNNPNDDSKDLLNCITSKGSEILSECSEECNKCDYTTHYHDMKQRTFVDQDTIALINRLKAKHQEEIQAQSTKRQLSSYQQSQIAIINEMKMVIYDIQNMRNLGKNFNIASEIDVIIQNLKLQKDHRYTIGGRIQLDLSIRCLQNIITSPDGNGTTVGKTHNNNENNKNNKNNNKKNPSFQHHVPLPENSFHLGSDHANAEGNNHRDSQNDHENYRFGGVQKEHEKYSEDEYEYFESE